MTTKVDLIAEIRNRTGDLTAGNYLISDTVWGDLIDKVNRRLYKYAKNSMEDSTTVGNGSSVYTIPASVFGNKITDIWLRSGSDVSTDRPVNGVRINGSNIYFPFQIGTGDTIVYWYSTPYTIGTDTLPDMIKEIVLTMMEVEWYSYAIARRSDFEQWAATTRSDARIGELISAKRECERALSEYASVMGDGIGVTNVGGGL